MTHEQITASWALRGDLARSASFRVGDDWINHQINLIADVDKLGAGKQMMARVCRVLALNATDQEIEDVLDRLYSDLHEAVNGVSDVEVKYE